MLFLSHMPIIWTMNSADNTIRIPKPDIFSFSECMHFLDRGYDDCLYAIEENRILKPLRIGGEGILIAITEQPEVLNLEICCGGKSDQILEAASDYVTRWFDLNRNLRPFYELLRIHDRLAFMPEQYHGLRLMGIPDLFEALCWCVIGQQINLTFAHRLKRRLVETWGRSIVHSTGRHYFFPDPEVVADLTVSELKAMQFSRRKAEYIIGIARRFAEGELSKSSIQALSNSEQMLNHLIQIRGVGPWTANYVLMKSLRQPDCITYGDTGLRSALSSLLELNRKPTKKEVDSFFEPFAGWESYLNIYLWRTLSR